MHDIYNKFYTFCFNYLPSYNRAKLITRAINSVINQTYQNWELLVIDDGSDDNTFNLVKDFSHKYFNIRYIYHKNKKLPLTLNTGILAANGTLLHF
jgi:glycosyltransferase involved in cell wall biosynthesis